MSQHLESVQFVKFFCGTIGLFFAMITIFAGGPALETAYWPVLGKLEFTDVKPLTDETAITRVRFTKKRDCEYLGISWYRGSSVMISERVSMTAIKDPDDTSSPTRIVGTQDAGPWRIGMSADDIIKKSYVVIYHRCHPFWNTMTKFYP